MCLYSHQTELGIASAAASAASAAAAAAAAAAAPANGRGRTLLAEEGPTKAAEISLADFVKVRGKQGNGRKRARGKKNKKREKKRTEKEMGI